MARTHAFMLFDRKKFFDGVRERIDPSLEQEQVDGLEFLLGRFETDKHWTDVRHIAYALATIFHETAGSFQPVEEGYYLGSPARVKRFQKTLRYFPFFGRGYVQLTWKDNYIKAGAALNLDLVKKPELALNADVAFDVLTLGLFRGWFGGKLTTYINDKKTDYVNARRCVNELDKAGLIAGYARSFEKILTISAAASSVSNPPESAEKPTGDGSTPLIETTATEQPPITTEVKTTEVVQTGASTVATEVSQTTPKGDSPDVPPTQVSKNGPLSKWLTGTALLSIGGFAWNYINSNPSAVAIVAICLTALILALVFRGTIIDLVRMQTAADPEKKNVT